MQASPLLSRCALAGAALSACGVIRVQTALPITQLTSCCTNVVRSLATASSSSRPKGEGILGSILFVPAIVSAGLAAWQYERMQWKAGLLDKKESLLNGTPKDALDDEPMEDYQAAFAEGHFLHSKSTYVGPRTKSVEGRTMQGYVVITPFYNKERKKAILVNRGWVPMEWVHDPKVREQNQPVGKVRVQGVLQPPETPNRFVPDNQPNMGTYFWLDSQTMAEVLGLPSNTRLLQVMADDVQAELQSELTSSNPFTATKRHALTGQPTAVQYPMPKTKADMLNFSVMPVDHRNYVLVWSSLSASVAYMAFRFVRQGR